MASAGDVLEYTLAGKNVEISVVKATVVEASVVVGIGIGIVGNEVASVTVLLVEACASRVTGRILGVGYASAELLNKLVAVAGRSKALSVAVDGGGLAGGHLPGGGWKTECWSDTARRLPECWGRPVRKILGHSGNNETSENKGFEHRRWTVGG